MFTHLLGNNIIVIDLTITENSFRAVKIWQLGDPYHNKYGTENGFP